MEVDSHQVINDINVGNQSSGMEKHLITKIRALLHQEIIDKIQHIYRKVNMCVDALARDRRLWSTSMCIFKRCPSFLNHI